MKRLIRKKPKPRSGRHPKPRHGRRAEQPVAGRFFTLGEVARAVEGETVGDPATRLSGVNSLDRAGPQEISWVADERRARQAGASTAGALLVRSTEEAAGKPAVVVRSPALAIARLLEVLRPPSRPRRGISPAARVHRTARMGSGVSVAAGATIAAGAQVGARTVVSSGVYLGEDVRIGEDSILYPNVAVLPRCRIGSRCILHAGAVVGSDGFGYVWDGAKHRKIPQTGIAVIEDDVEIGANTCIDRATLGETVVGRGTKIDNLVQVGHNVVIGEHSILCGQAGLAGSSRLGKRVTLAGQVGVGDHLVIGDGATATGQAGVTASVPEGAVVSGMPAAPHREFLRRAALVAKLPQLVERLESLERRLDSLEKGERPWSSGSSKS